MERPDLGSADLTEPDIGAAAYDDDGAEPVPIDRPARSRVLPALLAILLLGLLAGVGLVSADIRAANRRDSARQAALQAARVEAVNLTTISYQSADRDLRRIIDAATGGLKTQFEGQRAQFPAVLRRQKSVSVGTVLAAGVSSQSGSVVEALVAVDATVTSATSGTSGVLKHYRMDMRLVRISGRWLVSQVAFAGLPQ